MPQLLHFRSIGTDLQCRDTVGWAHKKSYSINSQKFDFGYEPNLE